MQSLGRLESLLFCNLIRFLLLILIIFDRFCNIRGSDANFCFNFTLIKRIVIESIFVSI